MELMLAREGTSSFQGEKSMGGGVVKLEGVMKAVLERGEAPKAELSSEVVKGLRSSPLALAVLSGSRTEKKEDG